jgi:hypothetical protein
MEKHRIENIQKAILNGRKVKLFNVFEYEKNSNAYIFARQFSAPAKTARKNLEKFIN